MILIPAFLYRRGIYEFGSLQNCILVREPGRYAYAFAYLQEEDVIGAIPISQVGLLLTVAWTITMVEECYEFFSVFW